MEYSAVRVLQLACGNGILGHLLGSKDVSREVASRAAAQTGLSADVLKRMLPLAATLMMGAFSKHSGDPSSIAAGLGSSGGGIAAMLLRCSIKIATGRTWTMSRR